MHEITQFTTLEDKLINIRNNLVLIDSDIAKLFGVETRDINKAVKNNLDKFPKGYILELEKEEKKQLVENFHRFSKLKHSTALPKAFSEKGLYMLATILKSKVATEATLQIIETFAKLKELSRNINTLLTTEDKEMQLALQSKTNDTLQDLIHIDDNVVDAEVVEDEVIETETRVELNLGIVKVSKKVKKKPK